MVDPGEKISATLKREFGEEALNSLQKSSAEKREIEKKLHALFSQEHLVVGGFWEAQACQRGLGLLTRQTVLTMCTLALAHLIICSFPPLWLSFSWGLNSHDKQAIFSHTENPLNRSLCLHESNLHLRFVFTRCFFFFFEGGSALLTVYILCLFCLYTLCY